MATAPVGRQAEFEVLSRSLACADAVRATSISGAPGIGKTTLLDAALASRNDDLVLRASITAVEQPLSWAGLIALVTPILDRIDDHDGPASTALRVALGVTTGSADHTLVAAGLTRLLAAAADERPVIIAIDDVHWLDRSSAAAVAYAVRSVGDRPVHLVVTQRTNAKRVLDIDRLVGAGRAAHIELDGLSTAGVYDIVRRHTEAHVTRSQLTRIHQVTHGNPLHVIETSRLLSAGYRLEDALLPPNIEALMSDRIGLLDESTRLVLAVAALAGQPSVELITECLPDLDVLDCLERAELAQVIDVDEAAAIRFRHPTLAAAASRSVGTIAQRRLHRLLAEHVDPDERGMHLDAAATAPDADVADALEEAGRAAMERGATALAAERLRRAAARTPQACTADVGRRLHAAAEAALAIGDFALGRQLLLGVLETDPDHEQRLLVSASLAVCTAHLDSMAAAAMALEVLVDQVPIGQQRCELLVGAIRTRMFDDIPVAMARAEQLADEARGIGDASWCEIAELTLTQLRFLHGTAADIDLTLTDGDAMRRNKPSEELLVWTDQLDAAEELLTRLLSTARAEGASFEAGNLISQLGDCAARRDQHDVAIEYFRELVDLYLISDEPGSLACARSDLAFSLTVLGHLDEAEEQVAAGQGCWEQSATIERFQLRARGGFVALARGDHTLAVDRLREALAAAEQMGLRDLCARPFRADLVEGLVAIDSLDEAEEVADEHLRLAHVTQRPRGLGDAYRSIGLVHSARGRYDEALTAFATSLDHHRSLPGSFERARTLLAAGQTARRNGRRSLAREQLETAAGMFAAIGSTPWQRRCDDELRRLTRRPTASHTLTATEAQVAELVASGRTNAEVGATLFISAKTVEANLTRIYRKLGVRSRTELAARVAER